MINLVQSFMDVVRGNNPVTATFQFPYGEQYFNDNTEEAVELLKSQLKKKKFYFAERLLDLHLEQEPIEKLRRDGKTPAPMHSIKLALDVINLVDARYLKESSKKLLESYVCLALSHDMGEDHNLTEDNLVSLMTEVLKDAKIKNHYGKHARTIIEDTKRGFHHITYTRDGKMLFRDSADYHAQMQKSKHALLIKFLDRIDNISTLNGAFDLSNQMRYLDETKSSFIFRNKAAVSAQRYPENRAVFMALGRAVSVVHMLATFCCLNSPEALARQGNKASSLEGGGILNIPYNDLVAALGAFRNVPKELNPLYVLIERILEQPHISKKPQAIQRVKQDMEDVDREEVYGALRHRFAMCAINLITHFATGALHRAQEDRALEHY